MTGEKGIIGCSTSSLLDQPMSWQRLEGCSKSNSGVPLIPTLIPTIVLENMGYPVKKTLAAFQRTSACWSVVFKDHPIILAIAGCLLLRVAARAANLCLLKRPPNGTLVYMYQVGGFTHLEKCESQWEGLSHMLWKIKND